MKRTVNIMVIVMTAPTDHIIMLFNLVTSVSSPLLFTSPCSTTTHKENINL